MIDNDRDGSRIARFEHMHPEAKRLRLKLDVLMKVVEFAAAIDSDRQPDTVETSFTLSPEEVPQLTLPSAIHEEFGPLVDLLEVTFENQGNSDRSAYSVKIFSGDQLINFSREAYAQRGPLKLHLSDGTHDPQPLCMIEQREANRLLASLIFPSKDGDFCFFDNIDPQDVSVAANITESLEKKSYSSLKNKHYILSGPDGGIDGELDIIEEDGTPISLVVSKRLIDLLTIDTHHERSMAVQIDFMAQELAVKTTQDDTLPPKAKEPGDDISIEFYLQDNLLKRQIKLVEPDVDELESMLDFLQNERQYFTRTTLYLMGDEDLADPTTDDGET